MWVGRSGGVSNIPQALLVLDCRRVFKLILLGEFAFGSGLIRGFFSLAACISLLFTLTFLAILRLQEEQIVVLGHISTSDLMLTATITRSTAAIRPVDL